MEVKPLSWLKPQNSKFPFKFTKIETEEEQGSENTQRALFHAQCTPSKNSLYFVRTFIAGLKRIVAIVFKSAQHFKNKGMVFQSQISVVFLVRKGVIFFGGIIKSDRINRYNIGLVSHA